MILESKKFDTVDGCNASKTSWKFKG